MKLMIYLSLSQKMVYCGPALIANQMQHFQIMNVIQDSLMIGLFIIENLNILLI